MNGKSVNFVDKIVKDLSVDLDYNGYAYTDKFMIRRIALVLGIMGLIIGVLGIIFLNRSYISHQSTPQQVNNPNIQTQKIPGVPTKYVGILPCAGCSGLKMSLMLYRNNPLDTVGIYTLQEIYLGTKAQPHDTRGTWKIIKGDKKDRNALVFLLTADNNRETEYFLKISENKIKLLNKQLAEIQSSSNYTLTKSSH